VSRSPTNLQFPHNPLASRPLSHRHRSLPFFLLFLSLFLFHNTHTHTKPSANKAVIGGLVEEFLAEKDQITGEDLGKLEKEVIVALKAKRRTITPAVQAGESAQQQQQQQQQQQGLARVPSSSSANPASQQSAPQQQDGGSSASSAPPPPGAEWSVIAAYQELQAEEKAQEEQRVARMKKMKFKESLDDHISRAKELRKKTEDHSDQEYSQFVNADVKRFHEEERRKKEAIHKKHHDELMQRKQQILDKMEAAKQAKLAQLEDEYRDLALAASKIEEEKEKMRRIRQRAMDNQAIVDLANQENNRIREIKRLADAEEDARLMREYAAKLDKEEEERAGAFQRRMDEMAKFAAKFENEGAGKQAKEERIRMEQLLLLEQKRKEEADAAKERKKEDDRRARLHKQMEDNARLLELKRAKETQLRKEDLEYQAFVLRDVDKYKQLEEDKKRVQKKKTAAYRVVLDEQKKNKVDPANPKSAAFVGREADINKGLLEAAIHEPKVLQRLAAAVSPGKSEASSKGAVSNVVAGGKSVVSQPMKIAVNK